MQTPHQLPSGSYVKEIGHSSKTLCLEWFTKCTESVDELALLLPSGAGAAHFANREFAPMWSNTVDCRNNSSQRNPKQAE
jgi:hypothetical protein